MSRSAGIPVTPTKEDFTTQSPSEQSNNPFHSSHASSSGGSSIYSTSSSSSRQHLSSGNTSPPCTLPVPPSNVDDRDPSTSKLHFSPASRGILQQSLEPDQHQSSSRLHRPSKESGSGGGGAGIKSSSGGSVIDTTMQSAPSTSSAAVSASSSAAIHDNRKYTETTERTSSNGQSNGQRPANKARRTSSGGSRVPGDDVGRRSGQGGSSASDSGSDWPHGPKVQANPIPANNGSRANDGLDDQQASTSSNYFASNMSRDASQSGGKDASHPHLDLAKYPAQDLLRLLAALLAQIATANDHIRPKGGTSTAGGSDDGNGKQRRRDQNSSGQDSRLTASSSGGSLSPAQTSRRPSLSTLSPTRHDRPTTAALSALETPSSTLCFHARNVPSISIESYLLRILKYCPATNEVFLSLLIYFDRMSKMGSSASLASHPANTTSELDMPNETEADAGAAIIAPESEKTSATSTVTGQEDDDTFAGMRGFAIDSYNVHRLVIAGVTVASKFFSDVFYTNSRYAKVGGLPVHELNQLELQFLLLNDFRLVIPLEEMQRYADQLLIYGGAPRNTWSESAEGSKVSGTTADRSAIEAVSRQGQRGE